MSNLKIIILPSLLVTSIALVWFFVKPIYEETRVLEKTKIPQLEGLAQQEKDLQQRTEKLFGETENESQGKTILSALPEDKNVKELIAQLEFIVKKQNMVLTGISVKDASAEDQTKAGVWGQTGKPYQQVAGELEIKGSYGQFKLLLKDIRKLNRIVNLNQVSVTNTTSEEGAAVGKYLVDFAVYWQPALTEEQVRTALENKENSPKSYSLPGVPTLPKTSTAAPAKN